MGQSAGGFRRRRSSWQLLPSSTTPWKCSRGCLLRGSGCRRVRLVRPTPIRRLQRRRLYRPSSLRRRRPRPELAQARVGVREPIDAVCMQMCLSTGRCICLCMCVVCVRVHRKSIGRLRRRKFRLLRPPVRGRSCSCAADAAWCCQSMSSRHIMVYVDAADVYERPSSTRLACPRPRPGRCARAYRRGEHADVPKHQSVQGDVNCNSSNIMRLWV